MITRRDASTGLIAAASFAPLVAAEAALESQPMKLPPPRTDGGIALMQALKLRRSIRSFSSRKLEPQTLSDLLWAAFGINRSGDLHTAPYWRHVMVLDIYLAMADGVWIYDPKAHAVLPHLADDLRVFTGTQDFVASAPLNLVYVGHGERMSDIPPEERRVYASVDAGFIGQNVYLYCASASLGSVFRASIDRPRLEGALKLPKEQFVTCAQSVGFPQ